MSAVQKDLERFAIERELFLRKSRIKSLILVQQNEPFSKDKRSIQEKIGNEGASVSELEAKLKDLEDVPSIADPFIETIRNIQTQILNFPKIGGRNDGAARKKSNLRQEEIKLSEELIGSEAELVKVENELNKQATSLPTTENKNNDLLKIALLAGVVLL